MNIHGQNISLAGDLYNISWKRHTQPADNCVTYKYKYD